MKLESVGTLERERERERERESYSLSHEKIRNKNRNNLGCFSCNHRCLIDFGRHNNSIRIWR